MITEYRRPLTLDEACALAAMPNTVVVGGGTTVTTHRPAADLVAVDLQALDLIGIEATHSAIHIAAMTPLQDLVDADELHPVLRDLARREAPRSIRNAATIGGTIAVAHPESELVAGLLAFDTTVRVARADGRSDHLLAEVVARPELLEHTIITGVATASDGDASAVRTARTPMDRPIVAVVARRGLDGSVTVAATGVASRPAVIDPQRIEALDPPDDFRGTSEYRRHVAGVLMARALDEIGAGR